MKQQNQIWNLHFLWKGVRRTPRSSSEKGFWFHSNKTFDWLHALYHVYLFYHHVYNVHFWNLCSIVSIVKPASSILLTLMILQWKGEKDKSWTTIDFYSSWELDLPLCCWFLRRHQCESHVQINVSVSERENTLLHMAVDRSTISNICIWIKVKAFWQYVVAQQMMDVIHHPMNRNASDKWIFIRWWPNLEIAQHLLKS